MKTDPLMPPIPFTIAELTEISDSLSEVNFVAETKERTELIAKINERIGRPAT